MSETKNQPDEFVRKSSSVELNSQTKIERGDSQTKHRRKRKYYSEQEAERFAEHVSKAARKV
ncbi:hypothetical protein DX887_05680 [Vibrio alginolyticus]|uniref:hypothetical protein n=1 Tax=Vibrio TaxID=662 RepID=UPI0007A08A90|nr:MULTISPECIES: hypothetical protein [Vibrio]EGR2555265.1 hypothetical protein [Vibrio alginolyticus]EHC9865479.1 hypothetical protein [Vibrio alginolyticus]EJS0321352.1 hypothetical protein [Vibrio alginolyticus]EJV5739628.1 hypothetical protein [Vibrio alginolyticus]EKD1481283.1 hypothetical protein [Vibrio alginolyticus]